MIDITDIALGEDRIAAIDVALASPFHVVTLDDAWVPVVVVGFQAEDEARMFATLRPENVVYLNRRDEFGSQRMVACRVLVQHPERVGLPNRVWNPKDDFTEGV